MDKVSPGPGPLIGESKNEFVDSGRAEGNFFDLLDVGMSFLFKHLSLSGKVVGAQKEEQLEIPAEALREALTNALCHRQLEKYNLTPSIAVYDDRVEIENPGRLPFDLTPETIKSAHASYPYNPLIAEVLYRSSFLESWGSGVGRMVDACKAQGVPEPEYEVYGGFVKIVFRRTTVKTTVKTTERILKLIVANPHITMEELARECGLTPDGVYYHTKRLREQGVLVRKNGRKEGYWEVKG